jgi:hypothetical protein
MVDALSDVCRVLAPEGIVLDLRPRSGRFPLRLVTAARNIQIGVVDASAKIASEAMADAAISHAVEERWLQLTAKRQFGVDIQFDTLRDLAEYVATRMNIAVAPSCAELGDVLDAETSGEPAQMRYHLPMMLDSYQKVRQD